MTIGRQKTKGLYFVMRKAFVVSRGETRASMEAANRYFKLSNIDLAVVGNESWFYLMMEKIRGGWKWKQLNEVEQQRFLGALLSKNSLPSDVPLPNVLDGTEMALFEHDLLRRR